MEPPQVATILIFILAVIELLIIATYEATFAVTSRSSLEKLRESGVSRAHLMLRVYESRHRLRLMSRVGEGTGVIAIALASVYLLQPHFHSYVAILAGGAIALAIFLIATSTSRRLRFAEEGDETRVPTLALLFVPLHTMLLPTTVLLEKISSGNYTDEDFKAEKEEELRSLVESESESGVIEEGEREMIQGVFGFHDSIVREVMVPRVDIVAVEESASIADLLATIKESGHSRVPLYEETLDNIRGIVYTKDLLQILVGHTDLNLTSSLASFIEQDSSRDGTPPFLHKPYVVPETKKIDELLRDLRTARTRLAVVIDEYGGTAGLVTTEDLVEEIVGELQDEYDDEEELFYWKDSEDTLVVNARINMDALNEVLETDLPCDGFDTLGGFIYDHLGQVPSEAQTFVTDGLEINILEVEGQRISQVQIRRLRLAEKPGS